MMFGRWYSPHVFRSPNSALDVILTMHIHEHFKSSNIFNDFSNHFTRLLIALLICFMMSCIFYM